MRMKPSTPGEGSRNAFSSLAIWRSKVQEDLNEVPSSPHHKLRLLLEHTKKLEQAVYGCLKHALYEAMEAREWNLISEEFLETQRARLYAHAVQELMNDKAYMLELARESTLYDTYKQEVQKPVNNTLSDYETLGMLKFGLFVWKANLARDLSLSANFESTVRDSTKAGVDLIDRCVGASSAFWTAQSQHSNIHEADIQNVRDMAIHKLTGMLEDIAVTHHVEKAIVNKAIMKTISN